VCGKAAPGRDIGQGDQMIAKKCPMFTKVAKKLPKYQQQSSNLKVQNMAVKPLLNTYNKSCFETTY
jgi:hypothetical protein